MPSPSHAEVLQPPGTSVWGTNIFINLSSNTPSLCSSLRARFHVWHPHERAAEFYFCTF